MKIGIGVFIRIFLTFFVPKCEILCHKVLIRLSDVQMKNVNHDNSAILQTKNQILIYTNNHSYTKNFHAVNVNKN